MNKQYRVVMHRAADKGGESSRQLLDPLEAEVASMRQFSEELLLGRTGCYAYTPTYGTVRG